MDRLKGRRQISFAKDINYCNSLEHLLDNLIEIHPKSYSDIEPFLDFEKALDSLIYNEQLRLADAHETQVCLSEETKRVKLNCERKLADISKLDAERAKTLGLIRDLEQWTVLQVENADHIKQPERFFEELQKNNEVYTDNSNEAQKDLQSLVEDISKLKQNIQVRKKFFLITYFYVLRQLINFNKFLKNLQIHLN